MRYILDCHCHTVASGHAYSTITEYAKEASTIGLELITITDHAPQLPGSNTHLFYFQNLKVVPEELYNVQILKGVEVNILNDNGDLDLENGLLKQLDYVVASIHPPCFSEESHGHVLEAYVNAMKNPYVNTIGHPDDARFPVDYEELVRNAKENHVLLEVNNSSLSPNSFRQNAMENYREMLRHCMAYGASIIISSDAHFHKAIGDFSYAQALLESIGFPEELIMNTSVEKLKDFLGWN